MDAIFDLDSQGSEVNGLHPEKVILAKNLSEVTLLQSLAKVFNTKPARCQEVFGLIEDYFYSAGLCFL